MFSSEIIIAVITTVVAAIIKMMAKKADSEAKQHEMALQKQKVIEKSRAAARKYEGRFAGFARLLMTISVLFAVFIAPFIIVVFQPENPIIYAYVEKTKGFLFLVPSMDQLKTVEMFGYVILPIHTQMAATVFGFWMGGELAK